MRPIQPFHFQCFYSHVPCPFKQFLSTTEQNHFVQVSLDTDQVRSYIIDAAVAAKEKMKEDLKSQFVFLKMDCATRIRVNYLGINVRFVSPITKLPTTQTLAAIDTRSKHTARELKEMIERVLEEYQIPLNHILCCMTDNASNMVKLVSTMNEVCTLPYCTQYTKQASVNFFLS
jgi:hypothetical protein